MFVYNGISLLASRFDLPVILRGEKCTQPNNFYTAANLIFESQSDHQFSILSEDSVDSSNDSEVSVSSNTDAVSLSSSLSNLSVS